MKKRNKIEQLPEKARQDLKNEIKLGKENNRLFSKIKCRYLFFDKNDQTIKRCKRIFIKKHPGHNYCKRDAKLMKIINDKKAGKKRKLERKLEKEGGKVKCYKQN